MSPPPKFVTKVPTYSCLKVHYFGSKQPAVKRGGADRDVNEIVLERDEWITRIEGSLVHEAIAELKFVSNKGSTFTGHTIGLPKI